MRANQLADRLLTVAAAKRKSKKKYARDVENSFDSVQTYIDDKLDYGQNTRVFRLLMRLKNALGSEGYKFTDTSAGKTPLPSLSSSSPVQTDEPGKGDYVVCTGSICTMLSSRVPAGMTKEASEMLVSKFQSKQCYRFTLQPTDKSLVRKSGKNTSLPKPVTWAKAENYGMEKSSVMSEDGNLSMDEFRIDGIRTYTLDRKTFYAPNVGMCRRWCVGLNRVLAHALEK